MTQSDNSSNDTAAVAGSNPTSSFSLEQYYREKLANVRQQLPEVARQLKDAGAACVHIQYDGCGDSGQIESIAYLDDEGRRLDLANQVSFTGGGAHGALLRPDSGTAPRLGKQRRRVRRVRMGPRGRHPR